MHTTTAPIPVLDTSLQATFAAPRTEADHRADGTIMLRSTSAAAPAARSIVHSFRAGAQAHPSRALASFPDHGERNLITWSEARDAADAVAQALLDRGLGERRPLMILAPNTVEHLILLLGAYTAGVPVLPISEGMSRLTSDHRHLRAIARRHTPGMVYVDDASEYGAALDALEGLVPTHMARAGMSRSPGTIRFDELLFTAPGRAVDAAVRSLGPDTLAKIVFTSGSTGAPKGVLTTHGMLTANQAALGQVWPFLHREPPVLVDWLPWSHTFGGSHNLNLVLTFGGTLHVDAGKPAPAAFADSLAALGEHQPTVYTNVPAGYALLIGALERDRELAEWFFGRLRLMLTAAAALPDDIWHRLRALGEEVAGHPVPLTASWGATETAPASTSAHFPAAGPGSIGVPLPGVTLKLVPREDTHEVRVSGPNVTPGYAGDVAATVAAFDGEGFYRTGDAVRLADPGDPNLGLVFDGRLAEDFKLSSGRWVRAGAVRSALLSETRILTDAVLAGHDGDFVAALAWINESEARHLTGADGAELDEARVREHLAQALARLGDRPAAERVDRLLPLAQAPSLEAGEITDKGYVNQRRVLERRADEVARLLADAPDRDVVLRAGR